MIIIIYFWIWVDVFFSYPKFCWLSSLNDELTFIEGSFTPMQENLVLFKKSRAILIPSTRTDYIITQLNVSPLPINIIFQHTIFILFYFAFNPLPKRPPLPIVLCPPPSPHFNAGRDSPSPDRLCSSLLMIGPDNAESCDGREFVAVTWSVASLKLAPWGGSSKTAKPKG